MRVQGIYENHVCVAVLSFLQCKAPFEKFGVGLGGGLHLVAFHNVCSIQPFEKFVAGWCGD